jgi:hypothetical protein
MLDRENIVKRFADYVYYFKAYCTSDADDHEMLKAVLSLLKEQDAFEQKQIFVKEGHSKIVQIICPCCGKKIGCDISVDTEGR